MDITSSLIAEIVSQCQKKGFVVSPQLAATYSKSLLLSEPKDDTGAVEVPPEVVERVVDNAVAHLAQSDAPVLESYKMQAALLVQQQDSSNTNRTELIQHRAKSQQLVQEVCSKIDHNKVFGDMVLYILHETGLFSSRNELVQKESMTALESVIPRSSVESFISQAEHEKMKQLEELWKIVWGIRLFNRETHKGGAGIADLPNELTALVQSSQTNLLQQRDHTRAQCSTYNTTLRFLKGQLDPGQWQRLNEEYCNRRQYLQYVDMILESVEGVSRGLATARPNYDQLVTTIKELVTNSNSVPKSLIYPRFIELSDCWEAFKRLSIQMRDAKRLLDLLQAFHTSFSHTLKQTWVDEALKRAQGRDAAAGAPNPLLLEQEVTAKGKANGCAYAPVVPSGAKMNIANNGFCLPSLLRDGLLRDGNSEVGYVRYEDIYYAFADEQSLHEFVKDPQRYAEGLLGSPIVVELALVQLLNLQSNFPSAVYLFGTRDKLAGGRQVTRSDADAQTGQIDAYKDYKYEWNEWELRRLALKLANLRNKRTHSCQTHLSHFKADAVTQTYPKRDSTTQTLVDSATQPTRTVQYIKGLRGREDSDLTVVKMTFDD